LTRISSGIEGLDKILCGGLISGSTYIVQGHPGSGKTTLANQIAFHHAASGQRVLYVTLLAEAHERLFQFLSTFDFYAPEQVGRGIAYVSAFMTMQEDGLDGVVQLLRRELPRHQATLLVLDGLMNAREHATTSLDVKKFVADLQGHAGFSGCTALLLTSSRFDDSSPEYTMVDGVIELAEESIGVRTARHLRVRKARGSASLMGLHRYEILDRGVVAYPRLELARRLTSLPDQPSTRRVPSGLDDLDALIGGGLHEGSATLLLGPSGSGKTTCGLHFLARSSVEAPGTLFTFYENPERLLLKARAFGLDLDNLVSTGALEMMWQSPIESLIDALAERLLHAVQVRGVKRLFIDGLGAFERAAMDKARLAEFFAALINELRARDVTLLASWELQGMLTRANTLPGPEVFSIADNLLLLRFLETPTRLQRTLSVVKTRDSAVDPAIRGFRLTRNGIRLIGLPESLNAAPMGPPQPPDHSA